MSDIDRICNPGWKNCQMPTLRERIAELESDAKKLAAEWAYCIDIILASEGEYTAEQIAYIFDISAMRKAALTDSGVSDAPAKEYNTISTKE